MKKHFFIFFISIFFTVFSQSNNIIEHTVEPGETIFSIARKYHITPYTLIKNNPGLGEKIKPGDVIIIPVKHGQDSLLADVRYVGFKYHTVGENETIFSISKKYNTTIEDIIKINKIEDNNIKLGQIIIIPILYDPFTKIDTTQYDIYLVQPKEGKWRVAYKHGISVEELERLNPEIKEKPLQINQRLIVPKNRAETKRSEDKNFVYYEVKPLETLYSLSRRFNVSQQELIKLNPVLADGLKAGQVLKIPKTNPSSQSEIDKREGKFIYHKVKPKETIYGITKKYNISVKDLMKYNPDLKDGLKAHMVLRIPKPDFRIIFDIKSPLLFHIEKLLSPKAHTVNLLEDIKKDKTYKFAVLLPLKLNEFSLEETNCEPRLLRNKILDYYGGIKAAVDSLKNMGVSVQFDLFDTRGSAYLTEQILNKKDLSDYDFVLGPLYENNIRKTLEALSPFNTPVVVPSYKSISAYPNLVQTATDSASLSQHMLAYINSIHKNDNIIIVYTPGLEKQADTIAVKLGTINKLATRKNRKGHWIKPEDLLTKLNKIKHNIIVLATDDPSLFANILSISEGLTSGYKLSLFALEKPKNLDRFDIKKMAAVNFHFPSRSHLIPDARLVKYTKQKFNLYPSQAFVNGFDTTFDLILRLGNADNLFDGLKKFGKTEESSYIFLYAFRPTSGFKNIASYIFKINRHLEPEVMD